jgi:sulfide:quinone oxidoreductase
MRVVVAGGGIAALEVLAGLRALAGERVDATLLAPDRSFSYCPLSMAVPITFLDERNRPLEELAAGWGATFVRDGLTQVDEARGRVLTHDGDFLSYDALVIAVGARPDHRDPDMTWSRSADATARLGRILEEIEEGAVRRLAIVVPPRAAWPVDAYEPALVASLAAERAASKTKISVFTAEKAPVEALGAATAEAIAAELARAGIELVAGVAATLPGQSEEAGRDAFSSVVARLAPPRRRTGERAQLVLRLSPGSPVAVDRVLFLPAVQVRSPRARGRPAAEAAGYLRAREAR